MGRRSRKPGLSRSKYLYKLIEEARSYRNQSGFLGYEGDQIRIRELEEEIDRLEARLEDKESEASGAVSFDPNTLKTEFLTEQYQSLEDILKRIVEEPVLRTLGLPLFSGY